MCSLLDARRKNNCKFISAVAASAATVFFAGQPIVVHAGVFEQICNGKVVAMGSDAIFAASLPGQGDYSGAGRSGVPTSVIQSSLSTLADAPDVPAGASLAADASRPTPLCDDPPAGTTTSQTAGVDSSGLNLIKRISGKLRLPAPNRLSHKFSDHQLEMREMTADVAFRFSNTPGVRKAKLGPAVFIKLFTTLVQRESAFKPRAVSPVGARGLGQLMPATARALGVKDSFAPEQNLVGAATYLTDMLDKFGSPELALAAYNAGPGAVQKHGGIPPYRETRQYVSDIFHEVLREPTPGYVTARAARPYLEPNVDVLVTALAAEDRSSVKQDPFAAVLREATPAKPADTILLSAYSANSTIESNQKTSLMRPKGKTVLATFDNSQGKAQVENTSDAAGSVTVDAGAPLDLVSVPPDLSTLPEPRAFAGELSLDQRLNRDAAVDAALFQANASSIERAGLTEATFATLFVALIGRESSFNSQAISPDGAKGLGQLSQETIRELGVTDPFSAKENLQASATHLARLLDQFGSPVLALAAYNAGSAAVQKSGGLPDDPKTRQFIADVMHDIKLDPLPDYVTSRIGKPKDDVIVFAADGMREHVAKEHSTLVSSHAAPVSAATALSVQVNEPIEENSAQNEAMPQATISPVAFSDWVTPKLTLGKLIAAFGLAFLITGICSVVADRPHGDRHGASREDELTPEPNAPPDTANAVQSAISTDGPDLEETAEVLQAEDWHESKIAA